VDATSIVLLVGVCSFWVAVGFMVALFGKTRKTLESLEKTLDSVRGDLGRLTPVLSDTLSELEKTGHEVGQTAAEVRVLTRRVNSGSGAAVVSNTMNYLPAAVAAFKMIKPLFARNRRKQS